MALVGSYGFRMDIEAQKSLSDNLLREIIGVVAGRLMEREVGAATGKPLYGLHLTNVKCQAALLARHVKNS